MKRKRQKWTRGNAYYPAAQVLVAEVVIAEESPALRATFLTMKTSDGRQFMHTADAGAFTTGDRVRIKVEGQFVREVVAAERKA